MSGFDDREKAFENKFKNDGEQQFKIDTRMARLFGLWAAEQMGLKGPEAEKYAAEVVDADLAKPGYDDLLDFVEKDFKAKGLTISRHRMQREVEACYTKARGS